MKRHLPTTPKSLKLFILVIIFSALNVKVQAAFSSYSLSTLSGVPLEDMTSGITGLIFSSSDDVASPLTDIGFSFELNGIIYTKFSVNSNGLMRLGNTVVSTNGINQLTLNSDFPKIASYWDDLSTGVNGIVSCKVTGTAPARKLIVEWMLTVPKNNAGAAGARFQTWLLEGSNVVQFVYGSGISANGAGYSVGMAAAVNDFLSINTSTNISSAASETINTIAMTAGKSYRLQPPASVPGCATSFSPSNLTTGVSRQVTLSWSAGSGTTTGYDIYFGTVPNPPLVSSNQLSASYTPSLLNLNTTYYWRIVPRGFYGNATGCTDNQFTTAPVLTYDVIRNTNNTFSSVSATGTTISSWKNQSNTDDNLSTAQPIGFNFVYENGTYSSFLVSTNGFITLNTTTPAIGNGGGVYGYQNNLSLADGSLILAPFYDDLVCQGNSQLQSGLNTCIKYSLSGSVGNRILTVEWTGMETYGNAGPNLNFQVKLYEGTNNIEFVYGTMESFNGTQNHIYSYTCGINAIYLTGTAQPGELLNQLTANTRNFGNNPVNNLNGIPDCNSLIRFTPGTYNAYSPVVSIPTNDNPNTAQHIDVNTTTCTDLCPTYFSSANGTSSSVPACTGSADDDVWFEFTATNPSTTIRLLSSGNYDGVVGLYNTGLSSLACKDTSGAGLTEIINATGLTVGTQYFVRVYHNGVGSGSASGKFSVCVSATPIPPSNDECVNAIILPVTINSTFTTGTQTVAATASSGIPTCSSAGVNADDDVWYKFTATNVIEVVTVQGGVGFNAVIQLFSGTCGLLSSIQCVNNLANGQTETLTASGLTINQTYYIRVFHGGIGGGSGNFSINVSTPLPACNTTMVPANASLDQPSSGFNLKWNTVPNANYYTVLLDSVNPPVRLLGTVTDTTVFTGILEAGHSYYWTVKPGNTSGTTSGCQIAVFATEQYSYALNVKVFIEDFYIGNSTMRATIDPIAHDTLCDTITVSLANPSTHQILYATKALLSTTGIAPAYFAQSVLGSNYFIIVKGRNALETWSTGTFGFNSPDTTYDFTTAANKAWGSNQKLLDTGVYGLYSGDINHDGFVNYQDFVLVNSRISQAMPGYFPEDLNGDLLVESVDYSMIENKIQLLISVMHP
jgi:hypothetical protein